MQRWGRYDRFLAEQFAYFLGRLRNSAEGDGNVLDHSLCLYGSGTSSIHLARNYPTILAGGNRLGLRHGRFLNQAEETPMANLFVTLLDRLGLPADQFADSTGHLSDLVG